MAKPVALSEDVIILVDKLNAAIRVLKDTLQSPRYSANDARIKESLLNQYKNILLPFRRLLNRPETPNLYRLLHRILSIMEECFKEDEKGNEYIFLTFEARDSIIELCEGILTIRSYTGKAAA